jgi:3-methyladenine DNA glycosylase/8-oxoguanine DNA glycosylase
MAAPEISAGEVLLLPLRFPVDLALTVASHGWAHLAPWHWDPEAGALSRRERIAGALGMIVIAQRGPAALVTRYEGFDADADPEIGRRVGRWLSVDWDPAEALAALAEHGALIRRGGGRLLRCSSFYEDFVKTVLTINTAWSSTCRMAAAFVAEPGGGAFPDPEAVLDYGEVRLRERAKLGFRAPTVIAATRRMLDDGVIDKAGQGGPDYEYLIRLNGIGPYAAAHCRLLLHDFSRSPVD